MSITELFANNFTTLLAAPVGIGDLSITVESAAPAALRGSGEFRVAIENEFLIVTAGASSTSWTVTRGAEGTSAAAHTAGKAVVQVLTEGGLAEGLVNAAQAAEAVDAAALAGETARAETAEGLKASSASLTSESMRAETAESGETSRAEGAEATNAASVASEVSRAEAAEATKAAATSLTSETSRAQAAEAASDQRSSNLSDVADAGASRANLHVPTLTPAACVATTNLALTGLQTIDGYTLGAGDLVLLTGQSTASQNGLYVAASGAWARPTEMATGVQMKARTVAIIQGTAHAGETWLLQTNSSVTVDTSSQTWVRQTPVSVGRAAQLVVLPAPSGGDDAAALNTMIAAAPAGAFVIGAPGTYQLNSAGLVLKGGINYDFALSAFTQVSATYSTPAITNAAQTPVATATDVSTTGATWDQWTATAGSATGGSGTWSFTWNGLVYTTPTIPYNATAAQVLAALLAAVDVRGLPILGGASAFATSGGALGSNPVVMTAGCYTTGPITGLAIATNTYTGGTGPTFAHTTTGVAPTAGVTSPTLAAVAQIGQTVHVVGAGPSAGAGGVGAADYSGEVQSIVGNVLTLGNIYGTTAPWTTVSGATGYLHTRDKALHIRGGSVTRTKTGAGSEESRHITRFRYVDDFRWETPAFYSSSDPNILYGIALGNITDFTVSGVRGNTTRDGVHVEGTSFRGTIRDVKMTTGDDVVALVTRGYFAAGQVNCDGDICDIKIEDVHSDLGKGVCLSAGVSTSLLRVTVDGIHGQVQSGAIPIRIQDVAGQPEIGGIYDDIVIRDIDTLPSTATSQVVILSATGMRNVTLTDYFHGSSLAGGFGLPVNVVGGAIESLTLNNPKSSTMSASTYFIDCNTGAWVGRLQINGGRIVFNTGCNFILATGASTIGHIALSNLSLTSPNGSGSIVSVADNTSSVPSVHLTNVRAHNLAWLTDMNVTMTIRLSNVELTSMASGIANVRANGNLRIVGAGFSSSSTAIAVTAGGVVSVNCPELQTDATKLTPQTGDRVYNTNATLAAGLGLVVWDGSYVSLSGSNLYPTGGSFEGAVNMAWFTCSHGTVTQSAAKAYIGSDSAALTADGTGTLDLLYSHAGFDTAVTAGQMYTFTFYALAGSTPRGWQISVNWYTSGSVFISTSASGNIGNNNASTWTQFQFSVVAPATAAQARLNIQTAQTPVNGEVHYVDAVSEYTSTVGLFRPASKPYFAQWNVPLIAGTATIADTRITLNSVFRVNNIGPAGTQGSLSVAPSAGSAVVASTSSTDTSIASVELVTP